MDAAIVGVAGTLPGTLLGLLGASHIARLQFELARRDEMAKNELKAWVKLSKLAMEVAPFERLRDVLLENMHFLNERHQDELWKRLAWWDDVNRQFKEKAPRASCGEAVLPPRLQREERRVV